MGPIGKDLVAGNSRSPGYKESKRHRATGQWEPPSSRANTRGNYVGFAHPDDANTETAVLDLIRLEVAPSTSYVGS